MKEKAIKSTMGCTCSKELPLEHKTEEERLSEHIELTQVCAGTTSATEQSVVLNPLDQYEAIDSKSEEEAKMEGVSSNKELAIVVEENRSAGLFTGIEEPINKESYSDEEERRIVIFDDPSYSENESQKLDSEDETTDIIRETSTVYKTYGEKYKTHMDPPIPGYDLTDQSFANSFCCLSQEGKLDILHSLLEEFDSTSQSNESDSSISVLYKLCLIILNERAPFGTVYGVC